MDKLEGQNSHSRSFEVVKQRLEQNSTWNDLLSKVRDEVIEVLETDGQIAVAKEKPKQTETVELINGLVSEYMKWMGYGLSDRMFVKESGTQPRKKDFRKQMASQLDLEDTEQSSKFFFIIFPGLY
ncbi:uncharacterized protein LOC126834252 isoform X2 [Adelges cooleyi]|uniref:uncharacterized protein LOC126834252 isoform X2 n=1 Tax=Adelges cooleyi TaxID=133065 RepID=UPI00218064D6|nr:uncharacterized protein LOC126834252 isoform X2 [Adelges cooleyi]